MIIGFYENRLKELEKEPGGCHGSRYKHTEKIIQLLSSLSLEEALLFEERVAIRQHDAGSTMWTAEVETLNEFNNKGNEK